MEFTYHYERQEPQQLKYFLKEQGISKGLLAKIKFQGGKIFVNDQRQNVLYSLVQNDTVTIVIPDEGEHETVLLDETPIEIVYEDQHLLIVNKPAGIASIPAQYHPNGTMANRVKAYYKQQGYQDQVIHVVTRLDRDTSGLMLFAKHGFAHAKLDVQLRQKQLIKKYQAIVAGQIQELASHGEITYPIARDLSSLLKRKTSLEGKSARTEYWLTKKDQQVAVVTILLHTGRTHQIRVHFAAIGHPLFGDDLYNRQADDFKRQALHCAHLRFWQPLQKKWVDLHAPLPTDMAKLSDHLHLPVVY